MKKWRQIVACLLAVLIGVVPIQQVQGEIVKPIRLEDDFYTVINKEWLESAEIKPGYTSVSNFTALGDQAREDVQVLFQGIMNQAHTLEEDSTAKKMVTMYSNYINQEKRNEQGIKPIEGYLKQIQSVRCIEDYTQLISDETMMALNPLYSFYIDTDMKHSDKKSVILGATSLSLEDADNYTIPTETSTLRREAMETYYHTLFQLAGYSEQECKEKIEGIFAFEEQLAEVMMGTKAITTHPNIYEAVYNVYTVEDLKKAAPHLQLDSIISTLGYDKASHIIVQEPEWLKTLDTLYTNANLEKIKACAEINVLKSAAPYLSEDYVKANRLLQSTLLGVSGEMPLEQEAFECIDRVFSDEIGKLYVESYFSEASKKDVEKMAKKIIKTYRKRIRDLDWMSKETKKNALHKLDTMKIKIGYPNKWEDYEGVVLKTYEEGGSLFDNIMAIQQYTNKKQLKEMNEPVDRNEFLMTPQTVNACYSPLMNDITFPAAILRPPFYDPEADEEANMGAIGVIIAHEITHAFDNTGARFDPKGNLNNWWTEEDYKKFEEKAQGFRDYFSKVEALPGQYINGDLTVGENIADIGAMGCMLQIMEGIPDANYKTFFESWATVWRMVAPDAYKTQLLLQDPHAPSKARVNEVVKQFEVFYETYNITPKDKMYLEKEKRLMIW